MFGVEKAENCRWGWFRVGPFLWAQGVGGSILVSRAGLKLWTGRWVHFHEQRWVHFGERWRLLTILAMAAPQPIELVMQTLQLSYDSIRLWIKLVLTHGVKGLRPKKSPGRRPKLTKTQKKNWASSLKKVLKNQDFQEVVGEAQWFKFWS